MAEPAREPRETGPRQTAGRDEMAGDAVGRNGIGPRGPEARQRQVALAWSVGVLAVLLGAYALKLTIYVTMPLVVAFFVAIAIWPVPVWCQRHLPRRLAWLGYVAAMAIVVAALALFLGGIWYAASQVAAKWPQYDQDFMRLWERAAGFVGLAGEAREAATSAGAAGSGAAGSGAAGSGAGGSGAGPLGVVSDYATMILGSVGRVVAMLVLIFFFVLLMLTEARTFRAKLADVADPARDEAWLDMVSDMALRFRWYVLVRTLLGLVTGTLYGGWLFLWGVDFALVWGLLAFLLNFVPTLGSLVAGILPVAFAFATLDLQTALLVGAGILAIEQAMGNFVDPRVQGRQLSLSPLLLLFMLLVWGWIWGAAGALLAVPLTALTVIVFARIPALSPIALALSNERTRQDIRERMRGL